MDSVALRIELHDYIEHATDEKVEEMYAMIKNKETGPYEWWKDVGLVTELERRSADLKSGKDKGVPWPEVKERLLSKYKKGE